MNITRLTTKTVKGNTLELFYNPENNLVVVDLQSGNGKGGYELLRITINEKKLLQHTEIPLCGEKG